MRQIPESEYDKLPRSVFYAVRMLNNLLELDPDAISALCHYQVPINDKLAESDLDFTCMAPEGGRDHCTLGALGIIQGCLEFQIKKYRLMRILPDEHIFEENCCVHCGVKKGEPGDDRCKERPEIIKFGVLELDPKSP